MGGIRGSKGKVLPFGATAFAIVGMAFFWQVLRLRNVTSLFPEDSASFFAFMLSLVVAMAAIVGSPRLIERCVGDGNVVLGASSLATLLMLLHWLASSMGWWDGSSLPACLAAFAGGSSSTLLIVAWYTYLSKLGTAKDGVLMILLFASSVLGFFLAVIMFSLSPFPALFPVLAPLCGGVCYRLCRPESAASRKPANFEGWDVLPDDVVVRLSNFGAPPSGLLLALLVLLGFLGNVALIAVGRDAQPDYTLWMKYVLSIIAVVVAFVALLRSQNERRTSFAIWLLLMYALVAGIALLGGGTPLALSVGVSVVTTCRTCSELLVVFLLVRDSFDSTVAYRNLSVLFIAPVVAASFVGYGVLPCFLASSGFAGQALLPTFSGAVSVLALAGLAVVLSAIVLKSLDREATPDWQEGSCGPGCAPLADGRVQVGDQAAKRGEVQAKGGAWVCGDLSTDVLKRIASTCGLTARETQIMVYAFKGYSLQHIAELDVVSINTVKSHWKNLYRKLDVHTRQELITFIESFDR